MVRERPIVQGQRPKPEDHHQQTGNPIHDYWRTCLYIAVVVTLIFLLNVVEVLVRHH